MESFKETFTKVGIQLLAIIIICLIAKMIVSGVSHFTGKVIKKNEEGPNLKRVTTSMTILRSASRYIVWFLAILAIISLIGGFNANNALLTAGVGTVIVTIGAQSLFSDIISGVFLVFDRQYEVGDYVKIGEYEGRVSAISIRATYLEIGGRKIIIPNGQVKNVINYHDYVACTVVIPVSYNADQKKVREILNEVCREYGKDNKAKVLDVPSVLGIDDFGSSSIDYKIYAKCYPMQHFSVPRDLRRIIKDRFDREGIEIPYTQVDVHITNDKGYPEG